MTANPSEPRNASESPTTHPEDMQQCREWAARYFSRVVDLPISFLLDGRPIRGIPEAWQPDVRRRRIDANVIETVFDATDVSTGLNVRLECQVYQDYPVIEWVAWFTNRGQAPTPVLQDILGLDGHFDGDSPQLYHCNGDFYSANGYKPEESPLLPDEHMGFAPTGGRPCDGAFPYYRIGFAGGGISLAIGWPAQWAVRFTGQESGVNVQVGQEKTHLRLLPGETIRTPRLTVMFWTGDRSRGVNLWRRWYLAHILPRPDGQPMKPLLACAATDEGEEFTAATEENQIRFIDKFNEKGIFPDVWWIDAGWYPCYNPEHERKWPLTGTWIPDSERFPRGMLPVSERAARSYADLLVWFEPERVAPGTQLDTEHPDWLLKTSTGDSWSAGNRLLNLGNPQCRQWLTDYVSQLIQDNGIKIYRQDFNFAPLEHWRGNEADDRQGINENLHVQGYLQYWDDLLARNPGLWIDSCSSGGRRNDLETMRRSVPLHYTDYGYGDHPIKLSFHHTLYEWIPYFKECTLSWDLEGQARFDHQIDSFSYHCGMAPMLFTTLDIRRDDYDYLLAVKLIAIWRIVSNLILYGDYYALTPFHRNPESWFAFQFDRPEANQGFLQGIRLPSSPHATLTVYPHALHPDAHYVFENLETGETHEITGNVLLRDGFTFSLTPRSGAIWQYHRL